MFSNQNKSLWHKRKRFFFYYHYFHVHVSHVYNIRIDIDVYMYSTEYSALVSVVRHVVVFNNNKMNKKKINNKHR